MAEASVVRHLVHEVGRRARRPPPAQADASGPPPPAPLGPNLELALHHADIGTVVDEGTRFRWAKQTMGRLARHFTHHQVMFNHAVLRHLAALPPAPLPQPAPPDPVPDARVALLLASVDLQLDDLQAQLRVLREENRDLRRAVARVGAGDVAGKRFDRFYRDFEDTFRGGVEEIAQRHEVYLEDILAATADGGRVVDLGAGRGELLELLAANGVDAYGVDLSPTMAERCRERGLLVVQDDLVAHLRSLPTASLAAVTGLHVVEHIGFDALLDLVEESKRVVRPGGVLILETPNPTTWHVGADLFHLDPTHLRPVHPLLLEFLLSNRGYVEVRTRMLHPYEASPAVPAAGVDPAVAEHLARFAAMWGGPQDYAVVGTRPPGP